MNIRNIINEIILEYENLALRTGLLSHSDMIKLGATGSLSKAFERYIPINKIKGLDPSPSDWTDDQGNVRKYKKGEPITKSIEVIYDSNDDVYYLQNGNHRIKQAMINGDKYIRAFVQLDKGKIGNNALSRLTENINDEISTAIENYQSVNFDAINNELRYDKPDKYYDVIEKIDAASNDKTSDDLYRGFSSDFTKKLINKYSIKDVNNVDELKSKLSNKIITDKGYVSTTRDLKIAGDFAKDKGTGKTTIMKISGNKTGVDVNKHVNNYRAKQEKEFIIKRNSKLKINDVSISKTGKLILYTEVVN